MRIGSFWVKKNDDGSKTMSGEIGSDVGLSVPAGQRLYAKLVRNDKKKDAKSPDYFLEAWMPRDKERKDYKMQFDPQRNDDAVF